MPKPMRHICSQTMSAAPQEGLYDGELAARAAAAERAAALFRSADALPALLAQGALVAALARCLREDGHRSARLCLAATGAAGSGPAALSPMSPPKHCSRTMCIIT